MKIKTLIACLGAFITLISGVGFNTLNNQKEVNQNENIIIADVVDSENNNDLNENLVINIIKKSTSYEYFLSFLIRNWSLYKIEWLSK